MPLTGSSDFRFRSFRVTLRIDQIEEQQSSTSLTPSCKGQCATPSRKSARASATTIGSSATATANSRMKFHRALAADGRLGVCAASAACLQDVLEYHKYGFMDL
jgi:hypothetical protein